ncbi:MAG: InlB B-repeat-containing protein [Paludibacteraceae bacterium]|nr:InlB B-repeat-containing protein [Paludibacteraceae bacterium]
MKNIFTKTLTLIAFLSLSIGLWGDVVTNLNVVYTTAGCQDGQQSQYNACGNYSDKDKIIVDSDFGWNKGKDDVCNSNNGGGKEGYLMVKNDATACSRQSYTFNGGDLSFTFNVACKDHGTYTGPTVKIDGKSGKFNDASFASDNTTSTISASITGVSAGQHTITIEFKGSDKFFFKELTMTEVGGGTTYALTLTNDGNGSAVSDQTDNSAISENTEVTITATPNSGYKFVNWTGSSMATDNPFSFTMTENKNYQANFAQAKQVTITITAGAHGSVDKNGGTYSEGTQITVTATPETGYEFAQWDDGNTNNPRTITVDESKLSYTASFRKQTKVCTNTLTWEAEDESKMVSPTEVTTCEYYKDKHCDGSDASSLLSDASNGHFISMKQNASADSRYIYYHFSTSGTANLSFVIRASSRYRDKTGYVTLYSTKQSGSQVFTCEGKSYKKVEEFNQKLGGDVDEKWRDLEHTFSAQPADDYIVAVRSSESWWTMYYDKFTITASDDVFCTEVPVTGYEITKGTHAGGDFTIKADDEDVTEADAGTTITLAVSSTDDCKEFSAWEVYETENSSNTVTVTDNTFEMPEFDVTVNATFATKTYTISYELGSITSQTISPFDATCGNTWVAPTVNPVYGWRQVAWHKNAIDGEVVTSGEWIPTEATTLYLEWAEDLSTVWYMKGTFNGENWGTQHDFVKATGHSTDQEASVTIQNLAANADYWFQIWDNNTNHGAKDDNMIMYHDNTGWYLDGGKNVGVHTTAAGDYTFTVNFAGNNPSLTVHYPEFVTVTVNLMGHGGNYELYTSPNGTISKPADPTADDYKFWGWYANSECTTPFDFAAPIATNTTIYAKWTLWETSTYTMHLQNTEGGDKSNFIHTETSSPYYYIFDFAIPATTYSENFFVGNNGKWYNSNLGYANSKSANWWYGWLPFTNLQGKSDCKITLGSASGAIGTLRIVDNSGDDNLYISFDPQGYGLSYGTPNQEGWVNMAFVQENASTVWNTTQVTLTSDMLGKSFYVGLAKQGGGYVYSSRSDNNMVGFSNTVAFTTMGVLTKADTWRSSSLTSADAEQVGHFQIWTNNTAQNGCCHFVLHYNATFVYNNAQTNTSTEYKSCLADNIITFPEPEAKTGYTFAGWFDNSSFTGTKYDAGSEFNLTNTGSKTFYAKWTPKTSHITFNANGGKIDSQDTKVLDYTYDGSVLSLPTPSWTGHHFEGWFTETTGGTQIDNVGGTNKPSEDVEYFAHWTINQHNLTWNTDGDELTGDYTHGTVDYGTTITAPNTPTKTGYTFAGWSSEVPATMPDNDVTLTATWNIINYTITYHNVEVGEHSNPTSYNIESSFTLSAPSARAGYDFGGWYIDSNFQTPITQITTGSHENKDIYAKWTAKQYTITLDKNASDGNNGSVKVTYNSGETTDFSAPTRDNYIIEGFYAENTYTTKVMNADGTLCTSVENYTDASGNWKNTTCATLYTKWAEKPKVDALIVTGDVNNATHNNGSAGFTYTHPNDAFFGHKVLKIEYSNMSGNYGNSIISIDNGYQSSSSTGATGFGFWYKTDAGVTSIAFCFDYNNGSDQKKTQLPGTNGAWKYVYVASSHANGWNGSNIIIWMNGTDNNAATGNWTPSTLPHSGETTNTNPSSGTLYISEIRATEITEKFINYTVTFDQPEYGSTSAQIKDDETITSGTEVPEGTEVIFTWNEVSGYDFVKFNDGTTDYTQNPCTLTVNSNLTITTKVDVAVTKHTLTVIAGENGSVSPTSQEVGETHEVIITATPNSHYGFASWTAEGITLTSEQEKQNPLTITMPTNDVTLTASFEYVYVDNMIATGNNTTTQGYGNQEMTVESVADANGFFNHNVLAFTYKGMTGSGDYRGINVNRDAGYNSSLSNGATGFGFYYKTAAGQTITFCFDDGNGNDQKKTELPSTNGFWKYAYVNGSAANGWNNPNVIIYVNGTGGRAGEWTPSSLNVSSATTTPNAGTFYIAEICATERTTKPEETPVYTATFAADPSDKATVTATVDDAPITSGGAVDAGKSITFDYSGVAANYRFDGWTATGISLTDEQKQQHPLTITMPTASITLTANFVRVYTLIVNKDANIASVTGAGQYAENEAVTVTATAAQGYKFTNWTEGAGGTELATTSSYTFDMPATDNYTVYANSEQDITYYKITLGECINGTISAKMNDQEYTGAEVTANTPIVLTATPNTGYAFVSWKDGSTDNPHTIYANAETETLNPWTATFAVRRTVTATYGKPGTEVTGQGEYATGAEVTLEAQWTLESKDFTYGFKEWTDITGVNLSDEQKVSNPLTFSMPASDVSMKATFAPVECVDTYIIQCEDGYIEYNTVTSEDQLPYEIPHGGNCGAYHDYYTEYHETGYYDYKKCTNHAMYYMTKLPAAATYSFSMWIASNSDLTQTLSIYYKDETGTSNDLIYHGVHYAKYSQSVSDGNHGPDTWPFEESTALTGYTISQPQDIIICLHATGGESAAFDQIKITADDAVFCEEKSIETFTIAANEAKEIPVSGVKNLVVYEGGQATNEDDVEVFETVKYIRSITEANIDQWSTFAVPYTATKTQVSKGKVVDDIYPVYLSKTNGSEQMGYYFMEVLTNKNAEAIGQESRARWDRSYTQQPQKDSAYITMFPRSQSDGYFIDSEIFYIGDYESSGGVTLTGSKNAFIENGGWPEEGKPKYYYFPNSAITAIQPYDAYVLSEDGTEFVLTDHPTILPFQCYIQATTEFKQLYPRLVMRQNGGGTTDLIPVTADGWKVSGVDKVMIDEVIYIVRDGKLYSIMGQLVK